MIGQALTLCISAINEHLTRRFDLDNDLVVLSNIRDISPNAQSAALNKVIVTLVNIEKDTSLLDVQTLRPSSPLKAYAQPPLHLNLYLVVAAHFENERYEHGLTMLSECAEFFHVHGIFDHGNTPDMPAGIQKLIWDVENLSLSEQSHIWGVLGHQCLPSIFYKVRSLRVDRPTIVGRAHSATTPDSCVTRS
jgi:hypothetical protein